MRPVAAILIIVTAAGAAWFGYSLFAPRSPLDVTLFFSCDTRGRLEPCGCFTGQYGGLTRLKTVLDQDLSTHSIRVDVGDAIRGAEDFHALEYKYILQAYAAMNYDAVNLGHREARLSSAQLLALAAESPVPLISANVIDRENRKPLLPSHRLVDRAGYKVALVGVTDPRGLQDHLGKGLAVEKMETALGKRLPEIARTADLVVLLAFTDENTLARLATEFYELDVILGGNVSQPAQELQRENRSIIFFTGNEARSFGLIQGQIPDEGKFNPLKYKIVLLHDQIPEDDSIRQLAKSYRSEVRNSRLSIDDPQRLEENIVPGIKFRAAYAGSKACLDCHAKAGKIWSESGHAHAFDSLVHKDADADPSCIGCHTVGFGTPSGYHRDLKGARLINVGCESCHGPGSLHIRQHRNREAITFKFRPLGAGDCLKCHHGEFSRPFVWEKFWPRIKHGQERPVTASLSAPNP